MDMGKNTNRMLAAEQKLNENVAITLYMYQVEMIRV